MGEIVRVLLRRRCSRRGKRLKRGFLTRWLTPKAERKTLPVYVVFLLNSKHFAFFFRLFELSGSIFSDRAGFAPPGLRLQPKRSLAKLSNSLINNPRR